MFRSWFVRLGVVGLLGSLGVVAFPAVSASLPAKYAAYRGWQKTVVAGLPPGGAHPGRPKIVYANPVAARSWKGGGALPVGSVVVKTAGPAGAPTLVAVMEKRRGGWYYEEYLPEKGRLALKFGGPGGQALCSGCHAGARAKDFLFTRP